MVLVIQVGITLVEQTRLVIQVHEDVTLALCSAIPVPDFQQTLLGTLFQNQAVEIVPGAVMQVTHTKYEALVICITVITLPIFTEVLFLPMCSVPVMIVM